MKIYGDRLVCVRYRYDPVTHTRYKTVELIVDEGPWEPPREPPEPDSIVHIRVVWEEADIRRQVKDAGGRWVPNRKLWALRYDQVQRLNLLDRIVEDG